MSLGLFYTKKLRDNARGNQLKCFVCLLMFKMYQIIRRKKYVLNVKFLPLSFLLFIYLADQIFYNAVHTVSSFVCGPFERYNLNKSWSLMTSVELQF